MHRSLQDVQKITDDVARDLNPSLAVLAATTAEGGSEYTEVTLTLRGCANEPCLMTIGLDRSVAEPALRECVETQLREHLSQHQP